MNIELLDKLKLELSEHQIFAKKCVDWINSLENNEDINFSKEDVRDIFKYMNLNKLSVLKEIGQSVDNLIVSEKTKMREELNRIKKLLEDSYSDVIED